jgi:predicted TIM-barrel fold metal-dependent hydrolase
MKIDAFPHIMPARYKEAFFKAAPSGFPLKDVIESLPTLFNLDHRFRIMDKFDGLMQILTLAAPPPENVADARTATELAKIANDEMAELVLKYPDRFPAAVACLPMNDMDAAMKELERAVKDLKFRGVQISTPINDLPLDDPQFFPLYEQMCKYNLPILIHPERAVDYPDYRSERRSRYMIFSNFGWPYETTVAMTRLVFSGVFEKYPGLKIVTHHCGGMVPFLEQRIIGSYDHAEMLRGARYKEKLTRAPIDYFRMFYNDTAIYGSTAGLMCGYAFCGAEHLLFATDFPYDSQFGERYTRQTIQSINDMQIPEAEKKAIFEENARRLFRLPI